MNQLGTVYATKRRRRNGKSLKPTPKDGVTKSNPSKRHRERLNAELDTLASLLPFEQNILSKLDRLSILRLSVSYLRTKSYFQVVMHKDKDDSSMHRGARGELTAFDHTLLDGEMFLQALNGFLMILTCEGEVFFATHSIEGYLGFHQSDIVHQSVYELVHSEDREELQRQLMWNSFLPPEAANMGLQDVLLTENCHLLERSFTVRFRCLLDNTSGFLRLDIRGRVKVLHGQNRKSEEPPLALFAICTPFGPPSLLEIPQKEVMFKSKHKLDFALVSMDQRGKMLLGYSDSELANMGGYDLVHYDDLAYVASAHQELLKTGASGMIAYRFQTKEGQWQWLQTSSRLVYKNSKPDFVISTHRPLMEEEGRDLLGKRTMDFKVSYLDAGLPNSYFAESDTLMSTTPPSTAHPLPTAPARVNRRYKTQLRDFLSTCRTKRKLAGGGAAAGAAAGVAAVAGAAAAGVGVVTSPGMNMAPVEYLGDGCSTAAYNMYPATYPPTPAEHGLSYMGHSANFQHGLYDQRYLTTTENLFHQYRPLGTYYPEYHTTSTVAAPYNGFASCTMPTYDPTTATYPLSTRVDEKLYSCQQVVDPGTTTKYPTYVDSSRGYVVANATKCLDVSWPYSVSPSSGIIQPVQVMSQHVDHHKKLNNKHPSSLDGMSSTHSEVSSPVNGILTPKMEDGSPSSHHMAMSQQNSVPPHHFSPVTTASQEVTRQTVLMWGSGLQAQAQHHISASSSSTSRSPPSNASTPSVTHNQITGHYSTTPCDPLKSLQEMNSQNVGVQGVNQELCKWNEAVKNEAVVSSATVPGSQPASPSLGGQHQQHHTHQSSRVVMVL